MIDTSLAIALFAAAAWALYERWERQRLQELVDERTDEMLTLLKQIEHNHKDED